MDDASLGVATGMELVWFSHEDGNSATFSPDSSKIVTTSMYGTCESGMRILVRSSSRSRTRLMSGLPASPDSTKVVTASWDGTARVWNAFTGREQVRFSHQDKVNSASLAPTVRMVTASADQTASVGCIHWQGARPIAA